MSLEVPSLEAILEKHIPTTELKEVRRLLYGNEARLGGYIVHYVIKTCQTANAAICIYVVERFSYRK